MKVLENWQCPLPYVHLEIQPTGDVFVCCHSIEPKMIGNLHQETLKEIWMGSERKKYEEAFNKNSGDQLEHCRSCKKLEDENGISGRQRESIRWKHDQETKKLKGPKSLAIRYSNLCNMKCRTCKPSTSTAWFSDAKKLNPNLRLEKLSAAPSSSQISDQIEWFLRNGLEKIYFAGGEALLEQDHYKTLKKIVELNPEIEVTYDTNFSILSLGEHDVLQYWNSLKNLTVSASIDGVEEKCEYLRSGLKWKDFEQNWNRIKKEAPRANIKIHYTVSLYNIIHFLDFITIATELGYIEDEYNLDIGLCEDPIWLNIRSLPKEIKENIKFLYQEFLNTQLGSVHKNSINEILFYMQKDYDLKYFIAFSAFTKKLDKLRNEKFSLAFPKTYNLYKKYAHF